jgi:hypothetical protein
VLVGTKASIESDCPGNVGGGPDDSDRAGTYERLGSEDASHAGPDRDHRADGDGSLASDDAISLANNNESHGSEDARHSGPIKDRADGDVSIVSDGSTSLANKDKRTKGGRNTGWLRKFVAYDFGSLFRKSKRKSRDAHGRPSNEEFDYGEDDDDDDDDDDASCNDHDASRDDDGSCVISTDESRDDIFGSIFRTNESSTNESSSCSFSDGTFSGSELTPFRPVNRRDILLVQ